MISVVTNTKKLFLIAAVSLLLVQCGGNDGGGSTQTEEGITVTFQALAQQSPGADGRIPTSSTGAKTFFNTEGIQITLTKAYLTLWSATLEDVCDTFVFQPFNLNWLIANAEAHADNSPTRMGVPNVLDLLAAEDTPLFLGETGPPPGDYCGVTIAFAKADQDAQYLPEAVDMLDRTLYIEGEYLPLGSTTAIPFMFETSRTLREAQLRYSLPLTLSSEARQATITLNIVYDRWFDGIDFNALSEQAQQDWLLNQITQSINLSIVSF